jgi:hypothetical protein
MPIESQPRPSAEDGLGGEGDLAVHASWYGKVQAGLTLTSDTQEKKEKEEACPLPELGCLATYRLCITCVNLSILGVARILRWILFCLAHGRGDDQSSFLARADRLQTRDNSITVIAASRLWHLRGITKDQSLLRHVNG